MNTENTYALLNAALIESGLDPAKAMKGRTTANDFRNLCLATGNSASDICAAAGI